jgi:hypothetical protein
MLIIAPALMETSRGVNPKKFHDPPRRTNSLVWKRHLILMNLLVAIGFQHKRIDLLFGMTY